MRIVLAFLIAPVVPSLLVNTGLAALNLGHPGPPLDITRLLSGGETAISYLAAILAGVPAYLLLRGRLQRTWWRYCACGAAIGCIPASLFMGYELVQGFGVLFGLIALGVGVTYGVIAGLAFWAIGVAGPTRAAV